MSEEKKREKENVVKRFRGVYCCVGNWPELLSFNVFFWFCFYFHFHFLSLCVLSDVISLFFSFCACYCFVFISKYRPAASFLLWNHTLNLFNAFFLLLLFFSVDFCFVSISTFNKVEVLVNLLPSILVFFIRIVCALCTCSSSDQLFTYDFTLSFSFFFVFRFRFCASFLFRCFLPLFVHNQWMHRRNYLLKKRLSKGPNKIVLSAADFVFPIDVRRVSCH